MFSRFINFCYKFFKKPAKVSNSNFRTKSKCGILWRSSFSEDHMDLLILLGLAISLKFRFCHTWAENDAYVNWFCLLLPNITFTTLDIYETIMFKNPEEESFFSFSLSVYLNCKQISPSRKLHGINLPDPLTLSTLF